MSDRLILGESGPLGLFLNEPHSIIYDPGKIIHDPSKQLVPFDSIANLHHEIENFIDQINKLKTQRLFILLIFPDKDEIEVRRFLVKYSSIKEYVFALYLIFPNGLQYHEKWINTLSIPKLIWCRSYSTQLIRNIFEICKSVCDQRITFYTQRQMQADDDIERGNINGAESIAALFARKSQESSRLLQRYYSEFTESDK